MGTRIVLADDHRIVRQGLRALIETEPELEVVGEASNGREAVELAGALRPDVVLMDISMPEMNGVEAAHRLREAHPEGRIIVLSVHSDQRFVARMLHAGASAYCLKGCSFDELLQAIRVVTRGGTYLTPSVARAVTNDLLRLSSEEDDPLAGLTPRERDVMRLIAEGGTPKLIAAKLHISAKTVSTHSRNIMRKLGVRSHAELVRHAATAMLPHNAP